MTGMWNLIRNVITNGHMIDKQGNVTGNEEKITDLTNHLMDSLDEYLKENPSSYIDVFMSAHNFHKKIVFNTAVKWLILDKTPLERTYRWADMTFRAAMRELKRR